MTAATKCLLALLAGSYIGLAADGPSNTLQVQLITPLRSDSPGSDGAPVLAILTRPLVEDGIIRMPARTQLHGTIVKARPVGLGLRRERAFVDLVFTHWQTPEGELVPLEAVPIGIDNAREQISRPGRVQGILAASNPLGVVRGIWYRPSLNLLVRAPSGLTGACGTAWSRLALGPVGAASLLAARVLLTRLPDPEIHIPAGAELTLRIQAPIASNDWGWVPRPSSVEPALADFIKAQPVDVRRPDGQPVGDIINIAFVGPERMMKDAFSAAGWAPAEELNRKSFGRAYHAFTERQGYPTAPVSKLVFQGRPPDLVFQKSLNSMAKRHHVRFWRVESPSGESVWLGAATHDVTVTFDRRRFSLAHRIDRQIDREREKLIGDLDFVGAVDQQSLLRRELTVSPEVMTDGAIAVARLREADFQPLPEASSGIAASKPSVGRRIIRRVTLETRHYLLRENAYYLAYQAARAISRTNPGLTVRGTRAPASF